MEFYKLMLVVMGLDDFKGFEKNSSSSGDLDFLKNLSLPEVQKHLEDMKNTIKMAEKSELGEWLNLILTVNNVCLSLSKLDITDASSYKDYCIEDFSQESISDAIGKTLTKLRTAPPGLTVTKEREDYMKKFESFFDDIYEKYSIPEDERNYTLPSIMKTRLPGVEPLTEEQRKFIVDEIQPSAMAKKNNFLSVIKNCQQKSGSLKANLIVNTDMEKSKSNMRSYWLSMQQYVKLEGSSLYFISTSEDGSVVDKKIKTITIEGDTVVFVFLDDTQHQQSIYLRLISDNTVFKDNK